MSYTIRYNRTTNHIDGIGARTTGSGEESGGVVGYYAENACGALTRSGSRMVRSKSFETLAEILEAARKAGGRKLCKVCEKAALAQLEAEAEAESFEIRKREQAEMIEAESPTKSNTEGSASLSEVLPPVDPNAHEVKFGHFECRTCGERSEWVKANANGTLETTWDADHAASRKGHRKFYMWSVTRNTAQIW